MRRLCILLISFTTTTTLMAQDIYNIPAWYLETDNQGNFYAAFGDKIFVFDKEGEVSDTIVTDFDETFGTIVDFRFGLDNKMYVLYDFNNGIYQMDAMGTLSKVLDGRFRYFDVDESGGILASIENGGEQILRYVNEGLDTTFILNDSINAANLVFDVQIDNENTFWISYAKGILSVKDLQLTRHNEESINDLFVADNKRIYVTYDIDRAGYKEPNEDEITKIDFDDAVGRRICGDSEGRIYVSDDNIVYVYSGDSWSSIEISDNVFISAVDFVVDKDNNVAMSTTNGKIVIWKQELSGTQEDKPVESLSLYPNPASDFISISEYRELKSGYSNYKIMSVDGKEMKTGIIQDGRINIMDLPLGLYSIFLEETGSSLKFVKK